mmetsp:Transcript_1061/g.2150  ORF Transcript_1061/g.2150 Transcript_1061/m.2150 type:complete len:241 (+) Transcript_1061:230-952(+)
MVRPEGRHEQGVPWPKDRLQAGRPPRQSLLQRQEGAFARVSLTPEQARQVAGREEEEALAARELRQPGVRAGGVHVERGLCASAAQEQPVEVGMVLLRQPLEPVLEGQVVEVAGLPQLLRQPWAVALVIPATKVGPLLRRSCPAGRRTGGQAGRPHLRQVVAQLLELPLAVRQGDLDVDAAALRGEEVQVPPPQCRPVPREAGDHGRGEGVQVRRGEGRRGLGGAEAVRVEAGHGAEVPV